MFERERADVDFGRLTGSANARALSREELVLKDLIPDPAKATSLARASEMSTMSAKVFDQIGNAFRDSLRSGIVKESEGNFTLPLEVKINTEPLYVPGQWTNDMEIQGAIYKGLDFFVTALSDKGFSVEVLENNGAYTNVKANVSWSRGRHQEESKFGDFLPSPAAATDLVRVSTLDHMGKMALEQIGVQFRDQIMAGKAKLADGNFTMPLEATINTHGIVTPGEWTNDIEIQFAISRSWDLFVTTLRDKGFAVEPVSHDGAYTLCKAQVTWPSRKAD